MVLADTASRLIDEKVNVARGYILNATAEDMSEEGMLIIYTLNIYI
jgi:hypothetical protein